MQRYLHLSASLRSTVCIYISGNKVSHNIGNNAEISTTFLITQHSVYRPIWQQSWAQYWQQCKDIHNFPYYLAQCVFTYLAKKLATILATMQRYLILFSSLSTVCIYLSGNKNGHNIGNSAKIASTFLITKKHSVYIYPTTKFGTILATMQS